MACAKNIPALSKQARVLDEECKMIVRAVGIFLEGAEREEHYRNRE